MGQKPFPPPPPRPDPRLTPQSVHGNFPPLNRSELPLVPLEQRLTQAHQVNLARLIKEHRQEEQEVSDLYKLEMERIAHEAHPVALNIPKAPDDLPGYIAARPRPADTSTHDSIKPKPVTSYGTLGPDPIRLSWRYYAAFWIAIDIALAGVALYITFSPKF
jgi:hypothetical protein